LAQGYALRIQCGPEPWPRHRLLPLRSCCIGWRGRPASWIELRGSCTCSTGLGTFALRTMYLLRRRTSSSCSTPSRLPSHLPPRLKRSVFEVTFIAPMLYLETFPANTPKCPVFEVINLAQKLYLTTFLAIPLKGSNSTVISPTPKVLLTTSTASTLKRPVMLFLVTLPGNTLKRPEPEDLNLALKLSLLTFPAVRPKVPDLDILIVHALKLFYTTFPVNMLAATSPRATPAATQTAPAGSQPEASPPAATPPAASGCTWQSTLTNSRRGWSGRAAPRRSSRPQPPV